jgi:SNF2 family DNA or RNA helicase
LYSVFKFLGVAPYNDHVYNQLLLLLIYASVFKKYIKGDMDSVLPELKRMLNTFTLRRTKLNCTELPPRIIKLIRLEFSESEKVNYDTLQKRATELLKEVFILLIYLLKIC